MAQPKRKSAQTRKTMMSVYPPYEVACAVGEYRVTAFNQVIRIGAQLLGDAAVAVAPRFTEAEWGVIATAFSDEIPPEDTQPGATLARQVDRAHHRYRAGLPLGKNADKAVVDLVARLERLSYLEAWAVVIACQFRADPEYADNVRDGGQWWDLGFRRNAIAARLAAKDGAKN